MLKIPFGEVKTYGEIADIITKIQGEAKVSVRAIGGAVGWNPFVLLSHAIELWAQIIH